MPVWRGSCDGITHALTTALAYNARMVEVVKSSVYDAWLRGLRDRQAKTRIAKLWKP